MNKQQFDMNIQAADNNSLRIGAANRILQLLQKQRYSNNENSAKRWVWELCQNAKDVCNSTGKVKISIDFDKVQRKVSFRHNGKAFSMDNILSIRRLLKIVTMGVREKAENLEQDLLLHICCQKQLIFLGFLRLMPNILGLIFL